MSAKQEQVEGAAPIAAPTMAAPAGAIPMAVTVATGAASIAAPSSGGSGYNQLSAALNSMAAAAAADAMDTSVPDSPLVGAKEENTARNI